MKYPLSHQKGIVLISVLLIVAIVALIAQQIMTRQSVSFKTSSLQIHQVQRQALQMGIVQWLRQSLKGVNQLKSHHLNQTWAQPMVSTAFAGAEVSGQLLDAQAFLNLNSLGLSQEEPISKAWRSVWQRVAKDENLPHNIDTLLQDWVDADNEAQPSGAESDVYRLKSTPYRTADRPMVSSQELTLLEGVSWADYRRVQNWVVALPERTAVNINTASERVLVWLSPMITPQVAQEWIEWRKSAPAKDTESFRQFLANAGGYELEMIQKRLSDELISVKTRFFLMNAQIQHSDLETELFALFERASTPNQQEISVIQVWHSAYNASTM
ncbi:type II secretion system minor pseudopilin GspK [Thiomicrospira sp. WB1]|uniref:type II secretion system minor pseudopilin GspK n=1 Tax=Thiomicrospira sp. WB1 TaxID=1685380 RepID=UPI000839A23F|nr:type II secretion system minor pseudopilin GspK [Thiomicrospira sp. WB1]